LNSFRFIQAAIEYEARRQIEIIEAGGDVDQETRLYDPDKGETRSMRSKEDAHDYRYFPDPDLLPLEIDDAYIEGIKINLPELPDQKRARFEADYGLSRYDAGVLTADAEGAAFYETVAKGRDPKLAANWVTQELFGYLNKSEIELADSPVNAEQLGGLVDLISSDVISGKIAKDVFQRMIDGEGAAADIVEKHGLKQVTDTGAIEAIVDDVIAANPDQAEAVKEKPKTMGWFVGQVMKASGGKANPQAVNQILRAKLGL
jgi:aspartyl-tRNA(Asn)/glutamyl-tRNA(Gln) amidotransferase subunit B